MRLKSVEINGFKSFAKKANLSFDVPVTAIVGPNGSGKSNVAESFRFVLGEQSVKSLRGKKGEDLIFGGGKTLARQNRASVKATFDNNDRRLPVDFDEVSLERIVHRDGFNEYFINGSRVRLKDVTELLAHANIGSSGHHIISQGEADRILSATPFERREMIEDALGLKIYHYRKKESLKKLEKTEENVKQVESLRREIAPHLNFLRKQVEKLEKGRELKEKLTALYLEYFKCEALYISFTKKALQDEKHTPEKILKELQHELQSAEKLINTKTEQTVHEKNLQDARGLVRKLQEEKDGVSRELWKIEGELSALARMHTEQKIEHGIPAHIAYQEVDAFTKDLQVLLDVAEQEREPEQILTLIRHAQDRIKIFFREIKGSPITPTKPDTSHLESQKNSVEQKLLDITAKLRHAEDAIESIRTTIERERQGSHEAERSMYEIKAKQNEIIAELSRIQLREEKLVDTEMTWKRELGEAGALIGHQIAQYEAYEPKNDRGEAISHEMIVSEGREIQEGRRHAIERFKIRLEDAGLGTGDEVLKEFKETAERDEFLNKELADLKIASASLTKLVADLDVELKKRFDEGIIKINQHFFEFFKTMFGGGEARLDIIKEQKSDDEESGEEDEEKASDTGIDVYVSLPHKKIKGLVMLSGGERALTSIALLFALSQVNPPPFIILDETDAALDEANSRKYGDMIEALAQHSQLILITHNRETMSRASTLYGVTMSAEGYSTLLSIKFEEAAKVAKN